MRSITSADEFAMSAIVSASAPRQFIFLDLSIDGISRQVWRDEQPINLHGLSLDLFLYLLQQGQRIVPTDELLAAVWQGRVVGDEALTQRIKLLRQALQDDSRAPRYLRSIRGVGYQLCAPVEVREGANPDTTQVGSVSASAKWRFDRRWLRLSAGLWATAAALVLLWGGWPHWGWQKPSQTEHAPSASDVLTVIDVDQQALLTQARHYQDLGQADDNGRAIALYRRVLADNAESIPAQAGLSHALSQRVCLFNAASENLSEAENLARSLIAAGLAEGEGHAALAHVYDCRGWVDAAIGQYRRALEYAPDEPSNLASYAYLLMVRGDLVNALALNLRAAATKQPLRFLDLQVAHVLELLGYVDAAEQRYLRTFELFPDNVFGNLAYPRFLYLQGRLEQAQERLDEALQRGVPRPGLYLLQAELALLRQQPERASAALAQASQVNPYRSYAATLRDLHDETSAAAGGLRFDQEGDEPGDAAAKHENSSRVEEPRQLTPAEVDSDVPGAKLSVDQSAPRRWQEQAMAEIQASVDAGNTWPDTWLQIALLHLSLGRREAALLALDDAVDRGFLDRNYLLISPWFSDLREEPEFLRLLERISAELFRQRQALLNAAWLPHDLLLPNPTMTQAGEDANSSE